jgi:phosphoenolpyruvate carboxylase
LPWLATATATAPAGPISPERLSQAYSIAFRLFGMVEQNAAVQQQQAAAGFERHAFPHWSEAERRAFLDGELASPRPFLRADVSAGPEADAVRGAYRVLVEHLQAYGSEGLGALIVSMTRSVSDLLSVYLFAREVGLTASMLERIYVGTLAERRPNIHLSLQMRKDPLRVLHRQQIALLREWRPPREQGDSAGAAMLLPPLLLTVNAIASGLGVTG